jgi:hypothetical protein
MDKLISSEDGIVAWACIVNIFVVPAETSVTGKTDCTATAAD